MSLTDAPTAPKTSAPGQYLGYSLQLLRLCHHLLRGKGDYQVSFEYLDDVAVHTPDGKTLLEQCKSVKSANAISDRAVDLWKTFGNWADLCSANKVVPADTTFRLYVTPGGKGNLALELSGAKTPAAVAACLEKVKKLLKTGKQVAEVDEHIARFLAGGDVSASAIIENFELVLDSDPDEAVKGLLQASLTGKTLNEAAAAAVGFARDRIDSLIRAGQKPILAASEFKLIIRAFIRKNNLANLLVSYAPKPTPEAITTNLNAAPVFVRQLQSVDFKPDLLTVAIADWLKTNADKTHWADEGMVFAHSFTEFDDALVRRHAIVRDEVEDLMSDKTPQQRGREVYRRCSETGVPLEGNEVPDHFVAGSYNCLADESKVGWHPDYATLFPAGKSD